MELVKYEPVEDETPATKAQESRPTRPERASSSSDAPPEAKRLTKSERLKAEILSLSTMCFYAAPRYALVLSDQTTSTMMLVYSEVFGMNIGLIALLRVAVKSIDILLGFVIGFVSDSTQTAWGRRIPFIALGAPVAAIAIVAFSTPPPSFSAQAAAPHAMEHVADMCAAVEGSTCEAVAQCVRDAIDNRLLPAWTPVAAIAPPSPVVTIQPHVLDGSQPSDDDSTMDLENNSTSAVEMLALAASGRALRALGDAADTTTSSRLFALGLWFALSRFAMYCGGHTIMAVPHDALGMELTTDYAQRSKLFSTAALFAILGSASSSGAGLVLASLMPSDMAKQSTVLGLFSAVMMAVGGLVCVSCVRERVSADAGHAHQAPFVPTLRDMLKNGPYINYLALMFCSAWSHALVISTFAFWLKYNLAVENALKVHAVFGLENMASSMAFLPLVTTLALKIGKKETLFIVFGLVGCLYFGLACTAGPWIMTSGFIYVLPVVQGLLFCTVKSIPKAMLSDIIDYDELHCGMRREGMYVIFETTCEQAMDIVSSALPALVLAAVGYRNNAGCSCGCGVACPQYFERWVCPNDIGYACSGDLNVEAAPLFGDPVRPPPCTNQPELVSILINVFTLGAPAVLLIIAAFFSLFSPIDAAVQAAIVENTRLRKQGEPAIDPVTRAKLPPYLTDANQQQRHVTAHYTEAELKLISSGSGSLVQAVFCWQMTWLVAGGAVAVTLFHYRRSAFFQQIATAGSMVLTMLLFFLVWETLRIVNARQNRESLDALVMRAGPTISNTVFNKNRGSIMGRLEVANRSVREVIKDAPQQVSAVDSAMAVVELMMQDPSSTVTEGSVQRPRNTVRISMGGGEEIEVALAPEQAKGKSKGKDFSVAAVNLPPVKRRPKTAHRPTVFMAGLEDADDKPKAVDLPRVPKDAITRARIGAMLEQSALLQPLSTEAKSDLIDRFAPITVVRGTPVIRQGDVGDCFYVVDSGKYEVTKSTGKHTTPTLHTYGEGGTFGELALLYSAPRAANVTCSEPGTLWALENQAFRAIMLSKDVSTRLDTTERFLESVALISDLSATQRAELANHFVTQAWEQGEAIVEMGDAANSLFLIKEGEVSCTQGSGPELVRLKRGEFFGESCLIKATVDGQVPTRAATCTAVTACTTLQLTREAFFTHLAELEVEFATSFKRKVLSAVVIDGVELISQLDFDEQVTLLDALEERVFGPGEDIIMQGAENNTFYIIRTGAVQVLSGSTLLATLRSGKFFGERALLTRQPANATVRAAGDGAICYCCNRAAFREHFGSLQDLLDDEMERRDLMNQQAPPPQWHELRVEKVLGKGSFATAKLARHVASGRTYALKCYSKASVAEQRVERTIHNEIEIMRQLQHPFALKMLSAFQSASTIYLLIELAPGGELASLLGGPLPDLASKFFVASVVSVVGYLHSRKIVYRDLKPENLLIDIDGYIKLADFGFAKQTRGQTFTLCGTPEYLAPEMIGNKGHTFSVDWWCVGILAYECLTATTPFYAADPMESYKLILKGQVPWETLPKKVLPAARAFVDALLVGSPPKRLGSGPAGASEVRSSKWLESIAFKKLEAKQLPAPFLPDANDDDALEEDVDAAVTEAPPAEHEPLFVQLFSAIERVDDGVALSNSQYSVSVSISQTGAPAAHLPQPASLPAPQPGPDQRTHML